MGCNSFRVETVFVPRSQGSSEDLATLIVGPKLFISGEESLALSPQPIVNNFARRRAEFCEQAYRRPERPAVTPRWMTNQQPVSLDELAQSFAPARRLDSGTNTQMPTADVCYKAFAESKPACPRYGLETTTKL